MTASRYQRSDMSDSFRASGLEQDQRDLTVRALLITGVVSIPASDERPHPGTLLRRGDPRSPLLHRLAHDPHLDRRVVAQIQEPGRMNVVTAPRGDHDVGIAF